MRDRSDPGHHGKRHGSRSTPLQSGNGYHYQTFDHAIKREGDMMQVLDVLANQVGILGIFSDWPATVMFYANCMGLK